jgi:DNA-binding response OmpR family regulator
MRILLAEGDPSIRELITELLTEEGHAITKVSAPEEALSLAGEQNWDLFLVDPPAWAGYRYSEQVKGFVQSLAARAPVILCTAQLWAMHVQPREVGATAIIPKPFDIGMLLESVRAAGTRP